MSPEQSFGAFWGTLSAEELEALHVVSGLCAIPCWWLIERAAQHKDLANCGYTYNQAPLRPSSSPGVQLNPLIPATFTQCHVNLAPLPETPRSVAQPTILANGHPLDYGPTDPTKPTASPLQGSAGTSDRGRLAGSAAFSHDVFPLNHGRCPHRNPSSACVDHFETGKCNDEAFSKPRKVATQRSVSPSSPRPRLGYRQPSFPPSPRNSRYIAAEDCAVTKQGLDADVVRVSVNAQASSYSNWTFHPM